EVEVLMERMKLLQESQLEEEGVTQEEMATRFELEKTESLLVAPSDLADHSLQSNVLCFVEDPEFGYKDFTRRGEQAPPTFRAQVGARGPTPVGGKGWHAAGWQLLLVLEGGRLGCSWGRGYDDYDYGEVNQLLERSLKIYIKTVACYPEKTTKRMYAQFWRHFKHSEKVHINLLLLEARMQA
ncbi:Sestrin-2, partial [Opisthocomus hoazin]